MSKPRRNRQRKPGRRAPFRDPKPTILIVCEGAKTEPQYLIGFKRTCRNPRVEIKIAPEQGAPITLVQIAKSHKLAALDEAARERDDNLAYDSVWCVFDIDDHPRVPDARVMARDNDIDLAISNPCFELWLLLHFRESPGMQDREALRRMLRSHVPEYDKHVEYETYSAGYTQAVARAQRLDRGAECVDEAGRNPSTGVHKLTELVRTE